MTAGVVLAGALVLTAVILAGAILVAMAIGSKSRRLTERVREQRPGACVRRVYGEDDFRLGLRRLRGQGQELPPRFLVLAIDAGRLEFWAVGEEEPFLRLEGAAIRSVRLEWRQTSGGISRRTVVLALIPEAELAFVVMRDKGAMFLPADGVDARALAAAIEAVAADG